MQYAGVAQSVVQLIRNQQVVCSSHITSSKEEAKRLLFCFSNPRDRVIRNLPYGQCCIRSTRRRRSFVQGHITSSKDYRLR